MNRTIRNAPAPRNRMTSATGHRRKLASDIVRRLRKAGFTTFWVGGCVRDFLLEREPEDYDVATSARPDDIEALFSSTVAVGRKFGVMVVVLEGLQFQVATFRSESDYRDGRHPDQVEFSAPREDASRRDFTINGLFHDPLARETHDWVGGKADLAARVIRTIGAPDERFGEDRLRLLRAVRLAAQLDFSIEPATFASVKKNAARLREISAERIRDELIKLFLPAHAARGLELLRASGLLVEVLPELAACIGCEQPPEHHPEGDVFDHVRLMLAHLPDDAHPLLAWAALLHDVGKPRTARRDRTTRRIRFHGHELVGAEIAEDVMARLRFPRKQVEEVVAAVAHHMQFKDVHRMRKATLRRILLRSTFPLGLELYRLDRLGSHRNLEDYEFLRDKARELEHRPDVVPPMLTGKDLRELGMKPGPRMGELLRRARDLQFEDELATREQAVQWARRQLEETS